MFSCRGLVGTKVLKQGVRKCSRVQQSLKSLAARRIARGTRQIRSKSSFGGVYPYVYRKSRFCVGIKDQAACYFSTNSDGENNTGGAGSVSLEASKFETSSSYLPHPDKVETNGEDAHMVSSCGRVIAVADGVGGWRDLGVDAGEFSRELMKHAEEYVNETGIPAPKFVLQSAYSNIEAVGTSTVCVVSINRGNLEACNLGDSGFCIFRRGGEENPDCLQEYEMVYKTVEQTHFFNCPYQIGTNSNDGPENAEHIKFEVNIGDLVVVATDGVFDNIFDYELEEMINENIDVYLDPKGPALKDALDKCSKLVATTAHRYGLDRKRHGPFSKNATLFGYDYSGGKTDDVTVVLGYVV